jgi:hypothetical protein
MGHGKNLFKLTDAARAIRAAKAAGIARPILEITEGKITIREGDKEETTDNQTNGNPWEEKYGEH